MATSEADVPFQYTEKDTILYALGVGLGSDPLDERESPFVYEGRGLSTVPTMAAMLLSSDFLAGCDWDFRQVLHSALRLELYRPLPAAASLLINRRVASVQDRGARKAPESRLNRRCAAHETTQCFLPWVVHSLRVATAILVAREVRRVCRTGCQNAPLI